VCVCVCVCVRVCVETQSEKLLLSFTHRSTQSRSVDAFFCVGGLQRADKSLKVELIASSLGDLSARYKPQ
jgi:hypothetical protein